MKHLLVSVSIMLTASFAIAQSDGANKEKYWKFRNDLKEKFIKIGPNTGESLPAGTLKPLDCVDNDPNDGSPIAQYGVVQWGDGMIRHGHYLGLLATEYRLLKNSGKDVTAVLNELYFALNAINRLDQKAEPAQSEFYFSTPLAPNLNGFAMREDIPENFASDNWGTDPLHARCTDAVSYFNNNAMALDNGDGLVEKFNSYQNTPSLDQITSLMVGFRLIHKLVDDEWVQPSGQAQGFYVVTETKDVVHRLMTYLQDHNWFIIDVNGWPVNNGGGDLFIMAAPLSIAATHITGHPYNLQMKRNPVPYRKIQQCLTGFGTNAELTNAEQIEVCNNVSNHPTLSLVMSTELSNAGDAGPFNNQNISQFQAWQNGGLPFGEDWAADMILAWESLLPSAAVAMDQILGEISMEFEAAFPNHTPDFLEDLGIPDYTETILFNAGVASGLWEPTIVGFWAEYTKNRQLELIDAVLKDYPPVFPQSFYRSYLDQMTLAGPYEMEGKNWTQNGENIFEYTASHPNGWASEYRWTHPEESSGNHNGKKGMYSAIDYMLFHNLYWLKFNSGIQMSETTDHCPCSAPIAEPIPNNLNTYQLEAMANLNTKLSYLPTCVPSALSPVFNLVTTPYTIQPKFSEYVDWNIFTTKYQLQNASIETGASLTVKTHLVLCDNTTVTVKPGAFFYVDKSSTQINLTAAIDVEGDLRVRTGTELIVKGKLRIKNGGKLIIEDGAKVIIESTGTLEYYYGALVQTIGANSSIEMKGIIKTMDATTFSIQNTGPNTTSAKLYIDGTTAAFQAEVPAYFKLEGKGFSDQFIVLRNGAQLKITDPEITTFRVADCGVFLNGGTSIRTERPFYSYTVNYNSTGTNGGFTVAGGHVFSGCYFTNVPIKVPNYAPGTASITFAANSCRFESTSSSLNPSDNALVKVTGGGYAITNSNFVGARSYCIESSSMTVVSSLTNCQFTNLSGTATGSTLNGVQDVSNVELKMTNCNVQKMQYGVNKSNGKLTLKCNYFGNNNLSNIRAIAGCILNMSINDFGGYNNLYKSLQNKSIEINNCTVNLKDGYNFIEACNFTISGTTSFSCSGATCVLDLAKNQWNTANSVPATSLFYIISANSQVVTPLVGTVVVKPTCGYYDGQIVVGPPRSTFDTDGMPIFYSTVYEDSIRLDVAIVNAMLEMTAYDSTGNDLRAINRFNEVFTADLDDTDSLTSELLWFALPHMKTALESAFIHEQLQTENNVSSYDSYVSMYANALTRMNPANVDSTNYIRQFYHEIDKAHLLRMIGHSDIGLNILTELESCGLDSAEQAHLNYWKQQFETDLVIEQIGLAALDTTIVIDTTGYLNPALVSNGYSFGAIINDLNNIQYPNCDFYAYRDLVSSINGMQVFPNPATEEVRISWNVSEVTGNGKLIITQTDGRVVYEATTLSEESGKRIAISDWKPGAYLVRYTDPSGKVYVKQLVVQ